jgi:hypothetical protein
MLHESCPLQDLRYYFLLVALIIGGFAIAFAVMTGGAGNYEYTALQLFGTLTGGCSRC